MDPLKHVFGGILGGHLGMQCAIVNGQGNCHGNILSREIGVGKGKAVCFPDLRAESAFCGGYRGRCAIECAKAETKQCRFFGK